MHLDPLEVAGLRLVLDEQPVAELSFIAADALVRGIDSPLLREAAASPADFPTSRDTFVAALEELGLVTNITEQDAVWRLVRNTAQLIVDEEISAHTGAHQIWQWSYRVTAEGDLRIFVGLASELDDHPSLRQQIEGQIRSEAARLLARQAPRTWVRLQPRVGGDWPLWNPNPWRMLLPDEVPCSKELADRLCDRAHRNSPVVLTGIPHLWGVVNVVGCGCRWWFGGVGLSVLGGLGGGSCRRRG